MLLWLLKFDCFLKITLLDPSTYTEKKFCQKLVKLQKALESIQIMKLYWCLKHFQGSHIGLPPPTQFFSREWVCAQRKSNSPSQLMKPRALSGEENGAKKNTTKANGTPTHNMGAEKYRRNHLEEREKTLILVNDTQLCVATNGTESSKKKKKTQ